MVLQQKEKHPNILSDPSAYGSTCSVVVISRHGERRYIFHDKESN